MASSLLSPPVAPAPEKKPPASDHNGNGPGGGDIDYPRDDPRNNPEPDPERWATPLSAYRTASLFVIFSIMSIFATLTHVLESRWVHSKDWVSIALPHILYVNTLVLVISSVTMELARSAASGQRARACARWLLATLLLGFVFVGGQLAAWRELVVRGFYVASNPGSFFFYFLTAALRPAPVGRHSCPRRRGVICTAAPSEKSPANGSRRGGPLLALHGRIVGVLVRPALDHNSALALPMPRGVAAAKAQS